MKSFSMAFGQLSVIVALLQLQAAAAQTISGPVWSTTVDVAGRQRMLVHQMSKEFLLVAAGIKAADSKEKMAGTIKLFDDSLTDLINGNSAKSIAAQPNQFIADGNAKVKAAWTTFKKLLEDNVDTVRKSDGSINKAVASELYSQNSALQKLVSKVADMVVDAAKAAGAEVPGLAVNIADRQLMLIMRICKETLFVALDVDTEYNTKKLKDSVYLFYDSHRGIVLGAEWAGVPTLTSMCTLQAMRDVSYYWYKFKHEVDQITSATTTEQSQQLAATLVEKIVIQLSGPVTTAMDKAVGLFHKDDGSCNPMAEMTTDQWVYLVKNMGRQLYRGQRCTELYMQIANNVEKAVSTVDLQVALTQTNLHLRSLIEGDKAREIAAPPTQQIADQLLAGYATWYDLENEIRVSINGDVYDQVTVARISALSRAVLDELNKATDLYVAEAKSVKPEVRGYIIEIASIQRMLFQKMGKEALILNLGVDTALNRGKFDETRALFKKTHWRLLLGDDSVPNKTVEKTTDICIVQQMKVVMDRFEVLEQASIAVSNGRIEEASTLIKELPLSAAAMYTAIDFYAKGSGECSALAVSKDEWMRLLVEMGKLRMLSQKVAHVRLNLGSGGGRRLQSSSNFAAAKEEFAASLKSLTYGSGKINVPAPTTKQKLDLWFALNNQWATYQQALDGNDDAKVGSASSTMLAEIELMATNYRSDIAAADPTVPAARLEGVTRRSMLVHKAAKEALLVAKGKGSSKQELEETISTFNSWHYAMKDGGYDMPAIIKQRPDLLKQWNAVTAIWSKISPVLLAVAQGSSGTYANDVQEMYKMLAEMDVELTNAVGVYDKPDPVVPPEEEGPPWTLIVYVAFAFMLFTGILISICILVRKHSKAAENKQMQV